MQFQALLTLTLLCTLTTSTTSYGPPTQREVTPLSMSPTNLDSSGYNVLSGMQQANKVKIDTAKSGQTYDQNMAHHSTPSGYFRYDQSDPDSMFLHIEADK